MPFPARPDVAEATINRLYATTTRLWGDLAYDGFMQAAVLDYVQKRRPRVLFVGYGETDEWAHSRRYDQTLASAHRVDAFIAELWRTMQAIPQYHERTTFIITTDHGRGGTLKDWTDHGRDVAGAEYIWIAVLGPHTPAGGERRETAPITQSQIAATVAAALGFDYSGAEPAAAPPISGAITASSATGR
jgi:bisphosphoglycerate-independent phosphoglycerate mutase (AlkP superfamily)